MAEGTNLGQAYVQVMPSAEGISGKLSEMFGAEGASAGDSFGNKFGSVMSKVGMATAVGAAVLIAKKVADVVNEAVGQYADYEQLTGGVEKLFGDSSNIVMRYAENAYKTAGISANDYMNQITSFSASLISSLDGDTTKAAEIGNRAIEDMADNANTFGTDIQSIQNAYQGFAKQNYTMLDNLKLGYGGTKTEMERLLRDAEKLNASFHASRDANDELTLSFSDIVEAIHIVQDDMNITGTTAREAADTISGSAASADASWANMMTTLADKNGNTKEAVEEWVNAVATSTEKKMEAVATVLSNLPAAIGTFVAVAAEKLNDMWVSTTDWGAALVTSKNLLKDHEDLLKSSNEILQEGLTPLNEAQAYWSAFKGLIDENGVIAEDHMAQADYLVQQINGQLGTQYSTQELINELLGGESTTLDEILAKKEAEIRLEASRQLMAEARAELDEMHAAYADNEEEIKQLQGLIETTQEGTSAYYYLAQQIGDLQQKQDELTHGMEVDTVILSQCWDNEAFAAEGAYEKISNYDKETIASADSVTQGIIDSLSQQMECERQYIADLEAMRTESNSNIINGEIAAHETIIKNKSDQKEAELAVLAEKNAQKQTAEAESNAIIEGEAHRFSDRYRATINEGMGNAAADFAVHKKGMEDSAGELYDNATGKVNDIVRDAKGAMNFDWRFPDLKVPTLTTSGGFSLNPLSVPTFGISWYAKAMDEAQVLNGATIFGSADGKLLGGGEVGSEVISGEEHLVELINDSVASVLGPMVPVLAQISELLNAYLPEAAEKSGTQIVLDDGTLVGKLMPTIDQKMASMQSIRERGGTCWA